MTTWYVRKTGSNTNGGSSANVRSTGTDGLVAGLNNQISSLTANWTSADINQYIYTSGYAGVKKITGVTQASSGTITTTNGSVLVTSTTNAFANCTLYQAISGPGIPANAYITVIGSSNSIQISAAAGAGAGTGTGNFGAVATVPSLTAGTGQTWTVGGAWLTLNNALVTAKFAPNVVGGDTVYVGAGVYRETVAVAISGSAGSPIKVIGDVTGQFTGDAGQVTQTGYTTNDKTAPTASVLLALGTQSYLQFSNMTLVSGTAQAITCSAGGHDYTFTDCVINSLSAGNAINFIGNATGPVLLNTTIERCVVIAGTNGNAVNVSCPLTSNGSADYDTNVIIRNCLLMVGGSGTGVSISASGALTYKGGGIRIYDCTVWAYNGIVTAATNSTTVPCVVSNCLIVQAQTGLNALAAGTITETYNVINASTPRTNVTAGTGSISDKSYAPLLELGQSYKWSGQVKPWLRPDTNSPLLGFSNAGYAGNYPTVDFYGRPRPSGGGAVQGGASYASVGYMESHDNAVQDTVTYPSGQTSSGKIVGPGDQDLLIPVDATSTTVSVQLYQGSGYGGTTYATASVLSNGELGVTAQTQTCSSTLSSWQTLTFSAFTPLKSGWITLRITSYDTSGTGTLNFGAVV